MIIGYLDPWGIDSSCEDSRLTYFQGSFKGEP